MVVVLNNSFTVPRPTLYLQTHTGTTLKLKQCCCGNFSGLFLKLLKLVLTLLAELTLKRDFLSMHFYLWEDGIVNTKKVNFN